MVSTGFILGRPAAEGPLGSSACLLGIPVCGGRECVFDGLVQSVHQQVSDYFTGTTLAELTAKVQLSS